MRGDTHADFTLGITSTPTEGTVETEKDEGSGLEFWKPVAADDAASLDSPIWKLWQRGTRYHWAWPCPHCREYFIPRFKCLVIPKIDITPRAAVERIAQTIAVYDDFCHANDPHEEHDFGSFEAEGRTIFFKIDYLDKTMTHPSPDPTDRNVTERVLTIMLAEEY